MTLDLGKVYELAAVRLGTPPFGSTRKVAIELSRKGKKFAPVASHTFSFGVEEKVVLRFPPKKARFVRVVFADHYPGRKQYDPNYMFLSELEVYPALKKKDL